MLIRCFECNNSISSKAIFCPHCGCPVSNHKDVPSKGRFRRLPNGYGSIKHLSGKRRRPFAAYPPTTEWVNGSPKSQRAIGYYASYNEAYQALALFHNERIPVPSDQMTFRQVYDGFMAEYLKKNRSASAVSAYKSSFPKCAPMHDTAFADLRKKDFQAIFDDNSHYSVSTLNNIKKLFNQMFAYAIENNIVDRNYASNVSYTGRPIEPGVPFSEEEIDLLWAHADRTDVQATLILIYSGCRIGELETIKVKPDRLIGGNKTPSGKNRVIPIHPYIKGFVGNISFSSEDKFRKQFYALMRYLKITHTASGEKHTPHDCRHTFSWLADKYHMDDVAKHMIMGHSLGKDVEKRVYAHRTFEELSAEIRKIKGRKPRPKQGKKKKQTINRNK